jgi:ComF family protein
MQGVLDRVSRAGLLLLDLVYPPRCCGCGRFGTVFCDGCQAQLEVIVPPVCRRCGCPMPQEGLCGQCRQVASSLDGITAVAVFAGPLRQAVHGLKYENITSLTVPLAAIMARAWRWDEPSLPDLIVPVPLHARRQADRGYNQSALLATSLGRSFGLPVGERILVRQRATRPQVELDHTARQRNVEGAFACRGRVAEKSVVVVDDVCTTGATLEACAQALKAAGARKVWGFALARALCGQDRV